MMNISTPLNSMDEINKAIIDKLSEPLSNLGWYLVKVRNGKTVQANSGVIGQKIL